jgi:FKBP-type peptidyl-prolyl cis-trans isomerase FklB
MKQIIALASVVIVLTACNTNNGLTINTTQPTELSTELDSVSYLLGIQYAKGLTEKGGVNELDNRSFLTGVQRIMDGKENEISEEAANECMTRFFDKIEEAKSAVSQAAGSKFLEENKAKEGVQVTETGLQYRVITQGTGAVPERGAKVKVHYTGKLTDGTVFDSSVDRGEPAQFGTDQVIPGWTEALTMMPVGSKWELVIPADLGYGNRAAGPIPSGSTLVFEVELLEIIK